ncbi:hypothetical protein Droror1_Dr00027099, partial [Drosera rotundifolia]
MSTISLARICIEVEASKPLLDSVNMRIGSNFLCLKADSDLDDNGAGKSDVGVAEYGKENAESVGEAMR